MSFSILREPLLDYHWSTPRNWDCKWWSHLDWPIWFFSYFLFQKFNETPSIFLNKLQLLDVLQVRKFLIKTKNCLPFSKNKKLTKFSSFFQHVCWKLKTQALELVNNILFKCNKKHPLNNSEDSLYINSTIIKHLIQNDLIMKIF